MSRIWLFLVLVMVGCSGMNEAARPKEDNFRVSRVTKFFGYEQSSQTSGFFAEQIDLLPLIELPPQLDEPSPENRH